MTFSLSCHFWIPERQDFGGCLENILLPSLLLVYILILIAGFHQRWRWLQVARRISIHTKYDGARIATSAFLFLTFCSYIFTTFILQQQSATFFHEWAGCVLLLLTTMGFLYLQIFERRRRILECTAVIWAWVFFTIIALLRLQSVIRKLSNSSERLDLWDWFSFPTFVFSLLSTVLYSYFRFLREEEEELLWDYVLFERGRTRSTQRLPELDAGIFSLLTFSWMSKLVVFGFRTGLKAEDLHDLHPKERANVLYEKAAFFWQKELTERAVGQRSLARAFAKAFWPLAAQAAVLKLCNDCLLFVGPLMLKAIINFLNQAKRDRLTSAWNGYRLVLILATASFSQTIFLHQYFHRQLRLGMRLRSACISLIYSKCLKISPGMAGKLKADGTFNTEDAKSSGELVNLMAVDSQRIQELMTYFHILWSGPLQIFVAMTLLYLNVGVSAFGGFLVAALSIPLAGFLARRIKRTQSIVMERRDKRLEITNEVISAIRVIKMYAWEFSFVGKILSLRAVELSYLWLYQLLSALSRFQWTFAPLLVTIFTLFFYTILGNTLTAATAFVTLSLVTILRFPLQLVPQMINNVVEATISMKRIQEYLETPECPVLEIYPVFTPKKDDVLVEIKDGVVSWPNETLLLENLNFQALRGQLIAIVGPTGAGKSGLLNTILGDLKLQRGTVSLRGSISYAGQIPWVQNRTVKENICFEKPMHRAFYHRVVEACALLPDFAVLPAGDNTEIGERGINLSGGQKQRICLARAVYHSADIYIFDDCFSSIDANVARWIFEKCFLDILKDKIVIVITHKVDLLSYFDKVVYIDNKTIRYQGDYASLQNLEYFREYAVTQEATESPSTTNDETTDTDGDSAPCDEQLFHSSVFCPDEPLDTFENESNVSEGAFPLSDDGENAEQTNLKDDRGELPAGTSQKSLESAERKEGSLIHSEAILHGKVARSVYIAYLKNAGVIGIASTIISLLLSNLSQAGSSVWLSYWSDHAEAVSNAWGVLTYGGLACIQVFFALFAFFFMALSAQNASSTFHSTILKGVLRAPLWFFDVTPIGRIMNRFAKDVYTVDEELPQMLMSYLILLFQLSVVIFTISFVLPWFLMVVVALGGFYIYVQRFYIPTARQLQRLDSVLRSPIFANFGETIDGALTIRAFQYENRFCKRNEEKMDANFRAYYLKIASNRWLAIRLECVGTAFAVSTAFLLILARNSIAAGIGGLTLSYALTVTQTLTYIVRIASNLESSIVSVERLLEYGENTPSEEMKSGKLVLVSSKWPSHGEIVIENLSLRYRPELPLVLNDISVHIHPGERVGIVGRTGAGKSSLFSAILRLVEPTVGRVLIDSVDTSTVNLQHLRSQFCIIPQNPTLFSGTLRFNLDPFSWYEDSQIWEALQRSHIKEFLLSISNDPLSMPVEEGGRVFSVGQRQMICLARAILRHSKLVLLDEATSVVDPQTDKLIQETIKEDLRECTILTVAHRIHTTLNSDRILVINNGAVEAFETPEILFAQEDGTFRRMCIESGIFQIGTTVLNDVTKKL